ncbi:prolipoprotein diacylglyceryl transferase family protein, partial [Acinetobacter baumannii]|uniref:prolipoprotein diacylglyceryl transferase family protein n=1 Tax=Acinetobacter baumannii TaxID=470 RepID=UPI001CB81F09
MLTYPNIDPVAIHLGPLQVHWYGLMYLLAFLCAWGLASYRAKQRDGWTSDMVSDLVFYGALGVVLGGRDKKQYETSRGHLVQAFLESDLLPIRFAQQLEQ